MQPAKNYIRYYSDILFLSESTDNELGLARCGLGGPIEYVVDCTLGYYKGDVPELGRYMTGEFPHKHSAVGVHYKV